MLIKILSIKKVDIYQRARLKSDIISYIDSKDNIMEKASNKWVTSWFFLSFGLVFLRISLKY